MSASDRELESLLDSLTLKEIMLVIKLYDLIMRRLRIHMQRYMSAHRTGSRTEDLISAIVYDYLRRSQQLPEAKEEEEVAEEKVKEFVEKLRKVMKEETDKKT